MLGTDRRHRLAIDRRSTCSASSRRPWSVTASWPRTGPSTRHLTEFYLWMSVGGMLGGMFNGLVRAGLLSRPSGSSASPSSPPAWCGRSMTEGGWPTISLARRSRSRQAETRAGQEAGTRPKVAAVRKVAHAEPTTQPHLRPRRHPAGARDRSCWRRYSTQCRGLVGPATLAAWRTDGAVVRHSAHHRLLVLRPAAALRPGDRRVLLIAAVQRAPSGEAACGTRSYFGIISVNEGRT